MIRIDLHTHSDKSYDGGLSLQDYKQLLGNKLDYIAITDHNRVDEAKRIQHKLGPQIIVGEEITTANGELIGLYLNSKIEPHLPIIETIKQIKSQNGLVYIPHPFEQFQRFSVNQATLLSIAKYVDIIETYNARSISLLGRYRAQRIARKFNWVESSASDAHGPKGIGTVYRLIKKPPSRDNLVSQLGASDSITKFTPLVAYLEPSKNKRARAKIAKTKKRIDV